MDFIIISIYLIKHLYKITLNIKKLIFILEKYILTLILNKNYKFINE